MSNPIFEYKQIIEQELSRILSEKNAPKVLKEAMNYSLQAGGKRIRPSLLLEFYRILGGDILDALNFACAVEMIHTYSLIHDDLPCMDDDDFRRGKPSCHVAFGQANALLAGDALLTLAFETAADFSKNIDPKNACEAVKLIANAAGMENMVGGQVLDLSSEGVQISLEQLEEIQRGKTVALLKVNASVAATLAGVDTDTCKALEDYAVYIGRAFQIRDDILDVISTEKELGKPIGSDSDNNKNTFVSLIGLDESQKLVDEYTLKAIESIKLVSDDSKNLVELAKALASRKN